MTHEVIATAPMAHMPVDPTVTRLLSERHGFSEAYLGTRNVEHQALVHQQLGKMSIALDISKASGLDNGPALIHGDPTIYPEGSFEAEYEELRHDPAQKLEYDGQLAGELLLKLGPTNQLRNREGFDGGMDLGRITHVLEGDFLALAPEQQRPERRGAEALVREELALLWRPTTPKKFESNPHKAFMFDLEDPNVFTDEQIQTLSESDRWKLIGARLSDEAADVFQAIAESPTAELTDRLTAGCRMTDMRIRSLRIQAGMNIDRNRKQDLYDQIASLNTDYLGKLAAVWSHPSSRKGVSDGLLFELFVVGQERDELIQNRDVNKLIRLALPREDTIHRKIYPYVNREGVQVNMSVDAVVEDASGNFVQAYQVKAMSEDAYQKLQAEQEEERGKVVYLPGHTEMRFADHYPVVSHGIDLGPLLVPKRAA